MNVRLALARAARPRLTEGDVLWLELVSTLLSCILYALPYMYCILMAVSGTTMCAIRLQPLSYLLCPFRQPSYAD